MCMGGGGVSLGGCVDDICDGGIVVEVGRGGLGGEFLGQVLVGNRRCDVMMRRWGRCDDWVRNFVDGNVFNGWADGADGGCWDSCCVAISGGGVFVDGGGVCVCETGRFFYDGDCVGGVFVGSACWAKW